MYRFGRRKGQPKAHRRFRSRASRVRLSPLRAWGALGLVLALVAGVIFLFGFSSAFVVEDLTVTGPDEEVVAQAEENAAVPFGRPMARVDVGAVEERVLADLRVAEADVGRQWPSTLSIDLTLREPAMVLRVDGTRERQLVDADGVVYDTADEAPEGLPLVRVSGEELDPATLAATRTTLEALPTAPDGDDWEVHGVRLDEAGELRFNAGSVRVRWGSPEETEFKTRVLEAMLAQEDIDPGAEQPEGDADPLVVDVSVPGTPVVTGLDLAEPEE